MRITRSPEDLCLICGKETDAKADATNSHFTPMGIIKSNTGKRDYEETHSIHPNNKIETYWGSSNLKNTDPIQRPDPHKIHYIFCNTCENLLSTVLESLVIDLLDRGLRNSDKAQNFPETKISDNIWYKECVRAESLRIKLFFYSIVWRQSLQQNLSGVASEILSPEQMEYLRSVIYSGLYEGIENNEKIANCYPITIVTANGFKDSTLHLISPHFNKNHPEVFCANDYLIFLYTEGFDKGIVNDDFLGLPSEAFSQEVMNQGSKTFKVTFIEDDAFEAFQKATWGKRYEKIRRDKVIDDFKHAFYLRYKSPIPENYAFRLNEEIHPDFLEVITDMLSNNPQEEFEGLVSNRYSFVSIKPSHPYFGVLENDFGCLLCSELENEEKYSPDVVLAFVHA